VDSQTFLFGFVASLPVVFQRARFVVPPVMMRVDLLSPEASVWSVIADCGFVGGRLRGVAGFPARKTLMAVLRCVPFLSRLVEEASDGGTPILRLPFYNLYIDKAATGLLSNATALLHAAHFRHLHLAHSSWVLCWTLNLGTSECLSLGHSYFL
jgi:hypothetical protein